jgi:putative MATE family efflux protein
MVAQGNREQMNEVGEKKLPAERRASLTRGPVGQTLIALTGPMLVGHLSVATFNLADTYFLAKLGTDALAAMGFILPVVLLIGSLAVGLGIGTSSVISRAIGQGDRHRVRRLTTDALALSVLVVAVFVVIGLATIRPLFGAMGAEGRVLDMIEQYMQVWYFGMVFVVVPMVGNHAIRSTGDTISPSAIMISANAVNLVLDPLLIFGWWGLPQMGIVGAAVATVIGRGTALVASLAILHFRKRMLTLSLPRPSELVRAWGQVLYVGVPAGATILLGPVSLFVIMWMVSGFGQSAVAAVGAGLRVERFAMMVVIALASVMVPFVGQNWGAGLFDRVRRAQRCSRGCSAARRPSSTRSCCTCASCRSATG